jgi:hypothetical protein
MEFITASPVLTVSSAAPDGAGDAVGEAVTAGALLPQPVNKPITSMAASSRKLNFFIVILQKNHFNYTLPRGMSGFR